MFHSQPHHHKKAKIKIKRLLTTLSLGLGLTLAVALFALISRATPGNPALDPPRNDPAAPPTTTVSLTYDEPISAATVTSRTFAVHAMQSGLLQETHGVVNAGRTIIVTPTRPFHQGELVYAIATTGTLNLSGAEPLSSTQWQFHAGQVAARCVGGFTDVGAGLAGVHNSAATWGDYDGDGDLDLLLTGYSDNGAVSQVYRNDAGSFSDAGAGLLGVQDSAAAWGDYDNDGDLDLLLIGQSNTGLATRVYRNDPATGSGRSFSDIDAGLPGFYWGSATWGDYDNDGDLDLLLTGYSEVARRTARLYRNDPAAPDSKSASGRSFSEVDAGLTGTRWGMAAWGDYDNDGDLDILLTGYRGGGKDVTLIYRNDGAGTFTAVDAGLLGVQASAAAWGDYDNDGDLDILLTGFVLSDNVRVTLIYRNDPAAGSGRSFTAVDAGLVDVAHGAVAWGDYDNDGDLDLLLTGEQTDGTLVSRIYRNDPAAPDGTAAPGRSFTDIGAGLVGVAYGSAAWGDYDGDGDLDILLTGYNLVSRIYRNDDCSSDPTLVKAATTHRGATGDSLQIPVAAPGDAITYTLSFSNNGALTATHIVITDVVPVGQVGNLSYAVGGDVAISGTVVVPTWVWQVAELPPGAGGVITLSGVLNADLPGGTIVTNTAAITAASDANAANNTSSATISVSALPGSRVYLPLLLRPSAGTDRYPRRAGYALRATPTEIDDAIVGGAAWLAANQQGNGSWGDHTAATCFALNVLQGHAYDLGFEAWDDPGYAYRDNIIQGWQYVFTPTRTVKVSPLAVQPAGDPDSNGNGYGVRFQFDGRHHVYAGGVCLAALEASRTPGRENDGGLDYDEDGAPDTFLELAQETVDWMAFAQLDGGEGRGNWYYSAQDNASGNPDQSNGGFAVLGLAAAESMGAAVPAFVRAELDHAIDYIQCSTPGSNYGGAGYNSPCSYVNEYKTGFLILQMGFYGDDPGVERFRDALDYIERHWRDVNNNPGWGYGSSPSSYLAMLPLLKGLRYNGLRLLDTDGDGERDDDWYNQEPPASPAQDLSTVLVNQQEPEGNWPFCDWGDVTLCTSWALLTLQRAALTAPHQPDAWIQVAPGDDFVGDDVYNADADAQTVSANTGVSETVAYLIRVENDGSATSTYTITGTSGADGWSVVYHREGGSLNVSGHITGAGWSTGDLAPGEAVSLTVEVTPETMPEDGPTYPVLVSVVSSGAPSRVDAVRADTSVSGYYYLDLAVELHSANAVAAPGDAITHALSFSNHGTLTATHVVISDDLPVGQVGNLSYTVGGDVVVAGTALLPPYAWEVDELSPGAGGVITISGVLSTGLPDGTIITHTASITTSAAPDAEPANNTSFVTLTVSAPPGDQIYLPLVLHGVASANARHPRSAGRAPHAPPAEIDAAIADGVAWLVADQWANGSWDSYTPATCFAVSVLQQHARDLGFATWDDPGYAYRENIVRGWQFILTPTRTVRVSPLPVQTAGDPDSNGNGYGVSFEEQTYYQGPCMMALGASGAPDRENDGGLDYDEDGDPDTFLELAQDAADWLAYGQIDGGYGRGNWSYLPANNESGYPDQSNGGVAMLGLTAVENMGATVPAFVRAELDYAIDHIQCDPWDEGYDPDKAGGAGYTRPCEMPNEYKTGFLVLQMGFNGHAPGEQRFQRALDFIERHWRNPNVQVGWGYDALTPSYLAMLALTNGLRYNDISLLDTDGDGAHDDEWHNQEPPAAPAEDLATDIVGRQEASGVWSLCFWGDETLCTSWALLILQSAPLPSAGLSVAKTVTPGFADPGQAVTYTLAFGNSGTLTATHVVITDAMPVGQVGNLSYTVSSGVTIIDTDADPPYAWDVAELPPGASGVITITGVLSPNLPAGYVLTNTATITTTAADSNPRNNNDTARITVQNVAPLAVNDAPPAVAEDSAGNALDVLANDSDANGDDLSVYALGAPDQGGAVLNGVTVITYTPAADFFGAETFTYTVSDGHGGYATAVVTVSVSNLADAPVADDDKYSTLKDTTLTIPAPGVLSNDADADGDALAAALQSPPALGTLSLNGDGAFIYTPTAGLEGDTTFSYIATDGVLTATATVTITVSDDVPTANADGYTTSEDVPLSVLAPGVLDNDSDPNSAPLTTMLESGPAHGALTLHGDGSFVYTPTADYNGPDSFNYRATNGTYNSNPAAVAIHVTAENDPPLADDDAFGVDEDSVDNALDVLDGDSFAPDMGETLTVYAVGRPDQGGAALNGAAVVTYTPAADFVGAEVFTYTVSDGNGGYDSATVTVTVRNVNDPPTISEIADRSTRVSTPISATFSISDPDSALDGLWLYAASCNLLLVNGALSGTLMLGDGISFGSAAGSGTERTVIITPTDGVTGTTTITITVDDGEYTAQAAFELAVVPNTPPAFTSAPVETATVGVLYTYHVTAADPDVDDTPTVTATTRPGWLTLSDQGSGSATLTGIPTITDLGPNAVTLQVSDGEAVTSQSFVITVEKDGGNLVFLPWLASSAATRVQTKILDKVFALASRGADRLRKGWETSPDEQCHTTTRRESSSSERR